MAFDAGMVSAVVWECRKSAGSRIDKIYQPDKDTVILLLHDRDGMHRLILSASANCPRFGFTKIQRENPLTAPMFCMLLRKHLGSAKLVDVTQPGFERVARFSFDTRDEMGFPVKRSLLIEVMGKCSNLMLLDENDKIMGILRPVDFTTSHKRQLLPGMKYEMPPMQEKKNPLTETEDAFCKAVEIADANQPTDRFLMNQYLGLSLLTAREIAYLATGSTDTPLYGCTSKKLWGVFQTVMTIIKENKYSPTLLSDESGKPIEYSWFSVLQYGRGAVAEKLLSFEQLEDRFFEGREHIARIHNRATDIQRLLTNAKTRLSKKLREQQKELADTDKMEEYRTAGDMITASIWQLKRGMTRALLTDYSMEPPVKREIVLDSRLTPAANAQAYYKKYQKAKTARRVLTEQIKIGQDEEVYLATVEDSLNRAETEGDFGEIRSELYESGYASRMKQYAMKKMPPARPMEFRTSGGYKVLAGKNNRQNEMISHKLGEKEDYWFHVKNRPGAHVVLFCNGEEPSAQDFTEAATIAAECCSKTGEGKHTAVDYTKIRYLKKIPGGKPGSVVYHTYWTAYVTPNPKLRDELRVKK